MLSCSWSFMDFAGRHRSVIMAIAMAPVYDGPCATGLLGLRVPYVNTPLRGSRTVTCLLHPSRQGAGFCDFA